jgi:hypothetical protein
LDPVVSEHGNVALLEQDAAGDEDWSGIFRVVTGSSFASIRALSGEPVVI